MEYKKEQFFNNSTRLGSIELAVYNALTKGNNNIDEIAKECRLTRVQVEVAMQLLEHKNVKPHNGI